MTTLSDVGLYPELQRYGATDMRACFSCGNCTAICSLSENEATFPRRMIRYAQVGMTDALISSKELWACYHCGQCSESCPTQADPGEFMAAARRYAIASYDITGLARLMALRPAIGVLVALLLAAFFALVMFIGRGPMEGSTLALFEFIPAELIHDLGVLVMVLVVAAGLIGIGRMVRRVGRREGVHWRDLLVGRAALARTGRALWSSIGRESLGQVRFREECDTGEADVAWYRRRWFIHAMVLWGFLGLLLATALDYALDIAGIKETGTPVPLWYPVRLLGTAAGLMLIYGASVMIVDRLRASNRAVSRTAAADWTLLALLWVTGVTGFILELALYLPEAPAWGYWVFLFHVAVAMELVLLAPFMKLAHAFYRPIALFFLALAREPLGPRS
jgi:ferredoxin